MFYFNLTVSVICIVLLGLSFFYLMQSRYYSREAKRILDQVSRKEDLL